MMIDAITQPTDQSVQRQAQSARSSHSTGFADVMSQKLKDTRSNVTGHTQRSVDPARQPQDDQSPEEVQNTQKQQTAQEIDKGQAPVEKTDEKAQDAVEETEPAEEELKDAASLSEETLSQLQMALELLKLLEQQGKLTEESKNLLGKIESLLSKVEVMDEIQLTQLVEDLNRLFTMIEAQTGELTAGGFEEKLQNLMETLSFEDKQVLLKNIKKMFSEADQKPEVNTTAPAPETVTKATPTSSVQESKSEAAPEGISVEQDTTEQAVQKIETEKGTAQSKEQPASNNQQEIGTQTKTQDATGAQFIVRGENVQVNGAAEVQLEAQQLEAKEIIQQIVNRVELTMKDGKTEMKLQLMPENLGSIIVKISLEKGTMTAKLFAENYQVKELIQNNLDQLKITLGEKGINVSSLEVSVGQDSQDPYQDQTYYQYQQSVKNLAYNRGNVLQLGNVVYHETEQGRNPYEMDSSFDALA